ncbi:CAP domain-containing protein [Domibacillus tundrae]|uniref:CAP domain-containing protein n=1 Tax=Domibacillus tundrae TaxID=1587527 RepID=UPI0033957C47
MKANIRIAAMAGLISVGLFTAGQAEAAAPTCNVANTVQYKTYKYTYQVKNPVAQQPVAAQQQQEAPAPAKAAPLQQETPAPAEAAPQQAQPAQTATNAKSVNAFEQEVAKLVNEERAKAGLKALELDTKLSEVARAKSQDMKDKGYFSHQSPTYGSPFDMMKQFGITYKAAGENIAKGQQTPEEVMEAWMNSDGHRKNILSADFTHIGVGYVDGHWTQMFIGK